MAIQQMSKKAAVQVGRTEQPIGNGKGEVHVHFHHQLAVVMRRMMWRSVFTNRQ